MRQDRIGGAMHVNRVGLQAHLAAIRRKRFDFIEQHDARAGRCLLGDHGAEQMADGLLAFPERRARERVRLDLDVGDSAVQRSGGARGEAACDGGLACAWWSDQQDDAVERQVEFV